LQARVFVNGTAMNPGESPRPASATRGPVSEYAAAIEFGHDEIDLKKTMLGKIVPFFGQGAKGRGPYAATGLKPVDEANTSYGSKWRSAQLDAKLQAKGKGPMAFTKKGGHPAYQAPSRAPARTSSPSGASARPAGSSPRPRRGRSCAPRWRAPRPGPPDGRARRRRGADPPRSH
jgi:hypothetical protein